MKKIIGLLSCLCLTVLSISSIYAKANVIYAPGTNIYKNTIGPAITPVKKDMELDVRFTEGLEELTILQNNASNIMSFSKVTETNYGLGRLAKVIKEKYNDNTICSVIQKQTDSRYLVFIENCSKPILNGSYIVNVYPAESIYESAPKNGYWYALYNEKMDRIGTCQAYKN